MAPPLGSRVDVAGRRIATEFDVLGRKAKITSYDNPAVGAGSIVNELVFVYDDVGQLVTECQEHGGAVNTSTSHKVGYSYASGRAVKIVGRAVCSLGIWTSVDAIGLVSAAPSR